MTGCGQPRYISDSPLLLLKTTDKEKHTRAACSVKRGSPSTETPRSLLDHQEMFWIDASSPQTPVERVPHRPGPEHTL